MDRQPLKGGRTLAKPKFATLRVYPSKMAVSNASCNDTSSSYKQYLNNYFFPAINDKTLYKK